MFLIRIWELGGEERGKEGRKEGGSRQSDINEAAILILFASLNVAAWGKRERERERKNKHGVWM